MKRKKIVGWVVLLAVFFVANVAFGQIGIRTGVKVGYNWATLSGDGLDGSESRKSMAGGVGIELSLLMLSVQADVLYSPKGVTFQDGQEIRLNYLSIPVVLKKEFFPVGIHPYLLGGPEFSFLLSEEWSLANGAEDQAKSYDLSLVVGGGVEFSLLGKSVYIEGRYDYGLNNINEEGVKPSRKNRVFQIFVGFLF